MASENNRISILAGEPRIRSSYIKVRDVLSLLAEGKTQEDILKRYPMLEAGDISACLDFLVNRRSQLAISFDGSLAYYGIVGVITIWLIIFISGYFLFLFIPLDDKTYLQMLFDAPDYLTLWVSHIFAYLYGAQLGMRFAPKHIPDDLKITVSHMVGIAMFIATTCFTIILISHNLL